MKNNFKKISAVLVSGLMLVSGIGFASAANYPTPFVSGSTADVAIVYGTNADNMDVVASNNIQADLSSTLGSAGTSGTTASGGDSVLLSKTSDNVNIRNLVGDIFTSTIDEDDLTTLLADGVYVAGDNDEFKYEQKITIGALNLTHFRDSDYEDANGIAEYTPQVGIEVSSGTWVMNYTLDFVSDAQTDITSNDAEDIEGSYLPLFGKTYYVSNLDNRSNSDDFWGDLTLLDSAETTTISEGETVTVAGHEISIAFIDNDEVAFLVDGERFPSNTKLNTGSSTKVGTDSYLGVTDISKLEVAGEVGQATFSIGSGKLVITSGSDIELNDDGINGVKAWVYEGTGSDANTIDKIVIEWSTDDDEFITPVSDLLMPGFGAIKFSMGDLVRPVEEKVTIQKADDDRMTLTVPIKDGLASFDFWHANATGDFDLFGEASDKRLATAGPGKTLNFFEKVDGVKYHKYFVASYNVTAEAESYLLRAKIEVETNGVRNQTDIEKWTPSGWVKTSCENEYNGESCEIGSVSLTIGSVDYWTSGNKSVAITATNDQTNFHSVHTTGGLRIYLPYLAIGNTTRAEPGAVEVGVLTADIDEVSEFNAVVNISTALHGFNTFGLYMDGEDREDNIASGTQFYVTIDDSSNKLEVSQVDGAGTGGNNGYQVGISSGVYEAYILDDVAPRVMHYTKSDNDDYAEVYYPTGASETYGEVYIAESGVVVSSDGGTSTLGEVLVTDAEVSTVQTKNLIVVGGSCINSAAATLLGGALCTADFTDATGVGAGEYIIKGYSGAYTAGKIALLVAGYEAADTSNAQKYLTTQTVDTSKEYIGTSATEAVMQ